MDGFIKTLCTLSVSGAFIAIILLFFKPFYKNRFSQKWQYYIWLLVIARLLIPFTVKPDFNVIENVCVKVYQEFVQPGTENSITKPGNTPQNLKTGSNNIKEPGLNFNTKTSLKTSTEQGSSNTENPVPEKLQPVKKFIKNLLLSVRHNIFYIWLITAIVLFTRKLTAYQGFIKYLKAGKTITNSLDLWEEMGSLIEELHIKANVSLYTNSLVSSPLLTGFFRPCIIIPSEELDKTDFKNIIWHELIHFKRKDMFYKWLVQLTACIHWFNPFVYLVIHETGRLCELSCDEAVIKNLGKKEQKEYGNTLLNMADNGMRFKSSIASVTLNESKKLLKERLDKIMEFKKKTVTSVIISYVLTLILCVTAATASTGFKNAGYAEETLENTKNINSNTSGSLKNNAYSSINNTSNQKSTSKYNAINKLIARNRVILDGGEYHILCDGVKKEDMATGSVSDGCIGITLEQADGGYIGIGPFDIKEDLDTMTAYVKKTCKKYVKNKRMTQKEADLMTGLAMKLEAGHGKIDGIKDISLEKKLDREYKKWDIKHKNGSYYYKNERVRIFVDLKTDKSFMTFNYDYKGTIDLKVTRNKKGKISQIKLISKKEADKFLED